MCHMYEKVTGKKSKGDISMLKGLLKQYVDAGAKIVIIRIPVEMMEIDTRYQTDVRTERDLHYLTSNWDERKLLPLIGVPHWEEGKVYIVDGYGRWIASQIVDAEKYKDLEVMVLLNAPEDKEERLMFEAELYAFQNNQVAKMTAIQKHGAMLLLHDPATEKLESLKKAYGFEYVANKGNREASVLGSYTETLNLCKLDHGAAANYVFNILDKAGFDRKPNGYATYMIRSLRDAYRLYANNREDTSELLIRELRETTPVILKASAVAKYPMLEFKTACSLYVEDMIVSELGLEHTREIVNDKVLSINKEVKVTKKENKDMEGVMNMKAN